MRSWLTLASVAVVGLGSALPLHTQLAIGAWQLTVGGQRIVVKIAKEPKGDLHGEIYHLGREFSGATRNGNPISTIEVKGRHVHFDVDEDDSTFDGELSVDGKALTGTATTGGQTNRLRLERATDKTAWPIDPSRHKVLFVPVEKGVRLEVLDWGGHGPPLIFLAGNGNSAHVFDDFAPKFTATHHVYGITRRGFGVSSRPAPTQENYDSDRLGDDVLAVIDGLKLKRPVIAGHSMAGEEMSSIGTRHPEKVSGLIYLDAGYGYAFYNPNGGHPQGDSMLVDMSTVRRDLAQLPIATPREQKALIQEMQATLPLLQSDLQTLQKEDAPDRPPPSRRTIRDRIEEALQTSRRKYSGVKAPALAIFASPHACNGNCDSAQVKAREAAVATQADAFEAGTPSAHVVRIANADHYVFLSNEAEVIRDMNAFMDGLH